MIEFVIVILILGLFPNLAFRGIDAFFDLIEYSIKNIEDRFLSSNKKKVDRNLKD